MPIIDVSYQDLCRLAGRRIPLHRLREWEILLAKGEVESVAGDTLKIDIKDTNRPDLWSAEGIAREIRGRLRPGMPSYEVGKPSLTVLVDRSVARLRPRTACAVVRGLSLTPAGLSQLIQLQEKIAGSFGRGRQSLSVGVYDLSRITPPIHYTAVAPDGVKFSPLEGRAGLTPREILGSHPKGREYGHLLRGFSQYPAFLDSRKRVLSLVPIINSNEAGRVTVQSSDLFIECSGFHDRFLDPALNVLATALAERGGRIEAVRVVYPDAKRVTPDLSPKEVEVDAASLNSVSGLSLKPAQLQLLLRQAGYEPSARGRRICLRYPAYRQDIMHPRDVAEDLLISYGYHRIPAIPPRLPTVGSIHPRELLAEKVSEVMIGLGLQEVLSYTLTSQEALFSRSALPAGQACEIENPQSQPWSVLRTWLLPSLLDFLSKNKHVEYPQRVFEVGDCCVPDPKAETRSRTPRKLAVALTDARMHYEEASSLLAAALRALGVAFVLRPAHHSSFLPGRAAEIVVAGVPVGFAGEVHPQVLNSWGLEKPVAGFELDLGFLLG